MLKDNKRNQLIQLLDQHIIKEKKVVLYGPLNYPISDKISSNANIYVDLGVKHSKSKNSIISIGDGDSAKTKMLLPFPRAKNKSDLALGLRLIKHKEIIIYLRGFITFKTMELRLDHLFANLGEAYVHSKKWRTIIDFSKNIRIYPTGKHELTIKSHFSLILFETTKIKILGKVKYPLLKFTKITSFQSNLISNKGSGKITIEANKPFLLIRY